MFDTSYLEWNNVEINDEYLKEKIKDIIIVSPRLEKSNSNFIEYAIIRQQFLD